MVDLIERPAGDDGERPAQPFTQGQQTLAQHVRDDDEIGAWRDVDQGAVEIEQQGYAARRETRNVWSIGHGGMNLCVGERFRASLTGG